MTRDSHLEIKVGFFVLSAVVAMTYFVVSVTDLSFFSKRRGFNVVFTFANGLRQAAPVRLAGVEAGLVKKMEVYVDESDHRKTKVKVMMELDPGIEIPTDSTVTINQLGLLGEKYVEILPGSSTEFFKPGASIVGRDPVPIEKITEKVTTLTEKLEVTVDGINNGLLPDLNVIVHNVRQGQGTVGKLLTDDSVYQNLEELTADLKANPWKLLYRPKTKG